MSPATTTTNQAAIEARRAALQAELERIVRVLIEQYDPERIILFGSFVHGNIHEWSDLDLCVIKQTDTPFMRRLKEVGLLTLPRVGAEILVYTPEEIETAQRQGNYFIVGEILAKGKVLYEKEDHDASPVAQLRGPISTSLNLAVSHHRNAHLSATATDFNALRD
jgi:predicted nucleotidyltransferase